MSGMKKANSKLSPLKSKIPITFAPNNPPIIPISSHGNRALVSSQAVSLLSTSSEIPDAI